ncbi:MAG TPA: hypothetical protein VER04_06995 [Polyangiaceae bacterium]|nr:hypothetical protein [Polyangiaceae bacterium]
MRLGWVGLWLVAIVGCGHAPDSTDRAEPFLGEWLCDSGQREIDCGQGVLHADLAHAPADVMRFERGTTSNLTLLVPSRVLVPGLPGGPSCQLAFEARTEIAYLRASSTCIDDQGADTVVTRGAANNGWRADAVYLDTEATTANGCHVKTSANCHSAR